MTNIATACKLQAIIDQAPFTHTAQQARELLEELNMSIESQMASQIVSYIHETAQHRKVDMPILLALLNARLLQAPEPELHTDGVEMGRQLQAEMTKGVITKGY